MAVTTVIRTRSGTRALIHTHPNSYLYIILR